MPERKPQRKCGHIKTREWGLVLWAAFGEGKEVTLGWLVYHLNDFLLLVGLCRSFKSSKLTHWFRDSYYFHLKKNKATEKLRHLPEVAQLVRQTWVCLMWKFRFSLTQPHCRRRLKFYCFSEGWRCPLSWVTDTQLLTDVSAGLAEQPRHQCYRSEEGALCYRFEIQHTQPNISQPNEAETNLHWVTAYRNWSCNWLFSVGFGEWKSPTLSQGRCKAMKQSLSTQALESQSWACMRTYKETWPLWPQCPHLQNGGIILCRTVIKWDVLLSAWSIGNALKCYGLLFFPAFFKSHNPEFYFIGYINIKRKAI